MPDPVQRAPRATGSQGWRIQWDVGQYAFLIWFHTVTVRLSLVTMVLMASFPSTPTAMALVAALTIHVIDAVPLTVRMREQAGRSAARNEVIDALPLLTRRIVQMVDMAGLLAVIVDMGWALWAKPWWPVRAPVSAILVALGAVGFVASVVLQMTRRTRLVGGYVNGSTSAR